MSVSIATELSSSPPGEYAQEIPMRPHGGKQSGPPILPPHLLQVILNKDTPAHVSTCLLVIHARPCKKCFSKLHCVKYVRQLPCILGVCLKFQTLKLSIDDNDKLSVLFLLTLRFFFCRKSHQILVSILKSLSRVSL